MYGQRLRKFLLLLVLCCLAFSSSADVVLTDGEYDRLLQEIDSLETSLKERDRLMSERQEEWKQREADLSERASLLNERQEELKQRESDLKERENSLTLKENLCQQQETFLKEQREGQRKAVIANTIDKALWAALGFVGGIGYGYSRR